MLVHMTSGITQKLMYVYLVRIFTGYFETAWSLQMLASVTLLMWFNKVSNVSSKWKQRLLTFNTTWISSFHSQTFDSEIGHKLFSHINILNKCGSWLPQMNQAAIVLNKS